MTTVNGPDHRARAGLRTEVLALPSATTPRYGVFFLALLAAGLFSGSATFTAVEGRWWTMTVARCYASTSTISPPDVEPFSAELARQACLAQAEWPRAMSALAGVGVLLLGCVILVFLSPRAITWRRRLRPVDGSLGRAQARVARLASEFGIHPPRIMVSSRLRDGFCFGAPGSPRIALPTAVLIRPDSPVFDVVVRHELAHIAHGDVVKAWLARSAWYVLAPLLAFPIVLVVGMGDLSAVVDLLWRLIVLAVVVVLVQRDLLRAREHDADLRAARSLGGIDRIVELVPDSGAEYSALQRLLRWHPQPSARRAVLHEPHRATAMTFGDGLSATFLATMALPLLHGLLAMLTTDSAFDGLLLFEVLPGVVLGAALGLTFGIGLWRQALAYRVCRLSAPVWPVGLGVFSGAALGQIMSFGTVGATPLGLKSLLAVFLVAVALTGALVTLASGAELWADALPWLRPTTAVLLPAVTLAAPATAVALVSADTTGFVLQNNGWPVASETIIEILARAPVAVVALMWAGAVAVILRVSRRGGTAPSWFVTAESPAVMAAGSLLAFSVARLGFAGGLVAAAVLVIRGLVTGPTSDAAELVHRVDVSWWVSGAAGAAITLMMGFAYGRRGIGAAPLASVTAAIIVSGSYLVKSSFLGSPPTISFAVDYVGRGIALALILGIAISILARQRALTMSPRAALAAVTVAAACGAALVLALGAVIDPPAIDQDSATSTATSADTAVEETQYHNTTAQNAQYRFATVFQVLVQIDRSQAPSDRENSRY